MNLKHRNNVFKFKAKFDDPRILYFDNYEIYFVYFGDVDFT